MASTDIIDNWIPIEWDSNVIQRVQMDSAVERYGYPVPMKSATKRVLRSAGLTVTAGTTYTPDSSTNDYITLTARRFISQFVVDEDDLADAESIVDVLNTKGMDWAISYSDAFDNACLAVSATENGTTVPFTSVYKALRTTNSATSYTADDNYLSWDDDNIAIASTPNGTSLYEKLSTLLKKVETGAFWSLADSLVIAAPGWRDALRLATDAQGRPIFIQGTAGTPDTLFNVPIHWSRGCKVSATMAAAPTGNDVLIFCNRQYLKRGDRTNPESLIDQARAQDSTDDTAAKFRVRRGFGVAHEKAFALLERITD
ncbi:phage major capsid protein [Streptomyces cinnamoneus]|uniref:phage major capsid protein n=1 Tax=Streptomyces cinnamoneus TaxID=53446 RepID=UPI0033E6308B